MPTDRYAIVADGTVWSVTEWDAERVPSWRPPIGEAVPCGPEVAAGWVYDGKAFAAPAEPPAERRKVPKSVVTARLIEADKMAAAMQALMSQPNEFARWIAADKPDVYADDEAALALLRTIGADAEEIMAP